MTAATTTRRPPELMAALDRLSGDEKHEPAALSTLDVLWVLYDRVLRVDPRRPDERIAPPSRLLGDGTPEPAALSSLDVLLLLYDRVLRVAPRPPEDPDRDRFLLSKGHGPAAFYAVLATKGFFPLDWLDDMGSADSRLGYHPDRMIVPGVEIGSGSLGHGLPLGVGTALGLRAQGRTASHVYVLVGDAELDEGSNHEAIAYAGATALDNLTVVVVDNRSATHGWPGGIARRFTANGWDAQE